METVAYIYTVIQKVFDKTITPEQALELIKNVLQL